MKATVVFYLCVSYSQTQDQVEQLAAPLVLAQAEWPVGDCLFRFFYGGDLCSDQRVAPPHFALQSKSFSSIS